MNTLAERIKPASIWRHRFGDRYVVISKALLKKGCENEDVVIYTNAEVIPKGTKLTNRQIWVRPVSEWVEIDKDKQGNLVHRFTFIENLNE